MISLRDSSKPNLILVLVNFYVFTKENFLQNSITGLELFFPTEVGV